MSLRHDAAAAAAIWVLTGTAQAALFDRGNGMIYDDALNITWLQDFNYAQTSGYDNDGKMTWDAAKTWAEDLVFGGFSDWRLPSVSPVNGGSFQYDFSNNGSTDVGNAKTGVGGGWGTASEMGHLSYVSLSNKGYCEPNDASPGSCIPQIRDGSANVGPFTNLLSTSDSHYWSGTAYVPGPSFGWNFQFFDGTQSYDARPSELYAVAVRPGDVAAVPEPKALALVLMGGGALMLALRQRDRR